MTAAPAPALELIRHRSVACQMPDVTCDRAAVWRGLIRHDPGDVCIMRVLCQAHRAEIDALDAEARTAGVQLVCVEHLRPCSYPEWSAL